MDKDKEIELHQRELNVYYRDMEKLKLKYFNEYKPKGYKTSTSYVDADRIHAKSRENNLYSLFDEMDKLRKLAKMKEDILYNLNRKIEVEKTLEMLPSKKEKVKFLIEIMGYNQKETGVIMGISPRQVGRYQNNEGRWKRKKKE